MRTTAAWWCLLAAAVVATDPRADAQYRRAIELDPSNPLLVVETERHFVEAARALFPPLVKALNKYPAARSWSHLRRVRARRETSKTRYISPRTGYGAAAAAT